MVFITAVAGVAVELVVVVPVADAIADVNDCAWL
jgi:hypothetical protein